MFSEIDPSLDSKINAGSRPEIDFLDAAISAHKLGNILLVLSRAQSLAYQANINVSNTSKRMLGFLSAKSSDYRAAMRLAHRKIIVCSSEVEPSYRISAGSVRISFRMLDLHHLMTQKSLLTEGKRDVDLLELLCDEYYTAIRYPRSYVAYRPLLGGGGAISHVLQSEEAIPHKGMMVCDRDSCGPSPPFKRNSTAQKAMNAANDLGLANNKLGISEVSPFFGFELTWGRTIENLIGPNALEAFFNAGNRRAERALFVSAFPDFPALDTAELTLWRYINLKTGTPVLTEQLNMLKNSMGAVPAGIAARLRQISAVSIPADAIDWFVANQAAQRWTTALRAGIQSDLSISEFRTAIEIIAIPLRTLAAGDKSARRS